MNTVFLNSLKLDGDKVIVKGGNAESGGSSGGGGDVIFRDYDGTILHSFSKDDFLALSTMPKLPSRKGLICQGWNYAIDDAKNYVSKYGILDIGATYITDDGKTRLHIKIAEKGRMTVPLYWSQTVSNGVKIDWGEGAGFGIFTFGGTGNINTTHNYSRPGEYTITLEPVDGCTLGLGHNTSGYCVMGSSEDVAKIYRNMLKEVEIGKNVTSINDFAFYNCFSLASVVIPEGVTSIGGNAFAYCYSLASVVIPEGVTSIDSYAVFSCYSLVSVVIPNSVTIINRNTFNGSNALARLAIPEDVTSIDINIFQNCQALGSVVIPQGVTSIGDYAFQYCYSLASVVIPQSVTSIGSYTFGYCYSLANVVIPQSVTSISNNAFHNCYAMAFYDFRQCKSVPTIGANAFNNIASDCKIIVPDSLYSTWKSATNWSAYASKIVKASEFNG